MGTAAPDKRAPHADARPRCGLRRQARLGAAGLLPDWAAMAPGRPGPPSLRLHATALLRAAASRARGISRTRRHHRHELVRQSRDYRTWCAAAAGARGRQPHRPACRHRDLHAAAREERRHRRRCHDHAHLTGSFSARHRRGLREQRYRLAAPADAGQRAFCKSLGIDRGAVSDRHVGTARPRGAGAGHERRPL